MDEGPRQMDVTGCRHAAWVVCLNPRSRRGQTFKANKHDPLGAHLAVALAAVAGDGAPLVELAAVEQPAALGLEADVLRCKKRGDEES